MQLSQKSCRKTHTSCNARRLHAASVLLLLPHAATTAAAALLHAAALLLSQFHASALLLHCNIEGQEPYLPTGCGELCGRITADGNRPLPDSSMLRAYKLSNVSEVL